MITREISPQKEQVEKSQTVRVISSRDPDFVENHGVRDAVGQYPLSGVMYSVYGALREQGYDVAYQSIGKVNITNVKNSTPKRWWEVYFDLPKLHAQLKDVDVVITWGTLGALLAWANLLSRRKKPKIITFSYTFFGSRHSGIVHKLSNGISAVGMRLSDQLVYMTQSQVRRAIALYGKKEGRVSYFRVGVDLDFFQPNSTHRHENINKPLREFCDQPYIVVSGDQLRDEEQIEQVLDGLGVGLVRLTLNKNTEQYWRERQDRNESDFPVYCVAGLTVEEVRFAYQYALCMLSLVDSSWQPAGWTVLTESLACGLPVIFNAGLVSEEMLAIGTDESLLPFAVVDKFEPTEIRQIIEAWGADSDHRELLGKTARAFAERHLNLSETSVMMSQIVSVVCDRVE